MVGSIYSKDGYYTSLEELLKLIALPAGSCTTQDKLVLMSLRRHVSPDVVCKLGNLVRKLCMELDVSIGNSEISMAFVGR